MSPAEIPNAEKIIAAAVRAATDTRVVGKTPSNTDDSWVRLVQIDAREVDGARHDHLVEVLVQLDCYAGTEGGQPEATALGRAVRAALKDLPNNAHEGATITGSAIRRHQRLPDAQLQDAVTGGSRERVILTAVVWMHA